jgi:DNA polymerase-1
MAWPEMYKDLESLDNLETYYQRISLTESLMYMQERGILMRKEGLDEASKDSDDRIKELTIRLQEMAGFPINPNSPKQLADYFYNVLGHKPYKQKGTRRVTTDQTALKRLARKGVAEATFVLEIRREAKAKGTYYDVLLDPDSRLRCSFNPVGAADTGRLSSSKTIFGGGANLQNQTKQMKKLMLADPGMIAYNIDLAQAENRVVAYIAPDQRMIEAFEEGRDIHSQTAGLILGKDPSEVSDDPKTCSIGSGEFSERFWGKKANHGLNYGLTYKGFALIDEIPENEAKWIVERYHQAYPGVREYHGWVKARLSESRILTTPLGRHRLFIKAWGDSLWKEGYAFIPQSTVGEMIALWGVKFIYDSFHEVDLLNTVHDSVAFQIPLSLSWDKHISILDSIVTSLSRPIQWEDREFSIPCDVSMGLNLGDMTEMDQSITARLLEETYEALISDRKGGVDTSLEANQEKALQEVADREVDLWKVV